MSLKRNNWTNEEIVRIVEGLILKDLNGEEPEEFKQHNAGIRSVVLEFRSSFMVPKDDYGALSYDTDTGVIYHTGTMLPQSR